MQLAGKSVVILSEGTADFIEAFVADTDISVLEFKRIT